MSIAGVSRREMLQQTAVGGLALAMGEHLMSPSLHAAAPIPCVDAHSHIWTRDVQKYPLAMGKTVADLAPGSFTAEELLEVAGRENVHRVVLICHHPYYGYDNSYLLDTAARHPQTFRVVAALDERQPQPDTRMRQLLSRHVTGFRITPLVSGESWLEHPGMDIMWRTAKETGQAMCCLINPAHLPQVEAMCARHPETPVVIDHFARIGVDGEVRASDLDRLVGLARFDKVTVKISAYYALGAKKTPYVDLAPMIKRLYEAFGPQRLMWASDSPYQLQGEHTYGASIALVRDRLDFLSDSDRSWLLAKTAEKVYFYA
jgi:predicted TIM-barrel fold metal-dependent hydrolase